MMFEDELHELTRQHLRRQLKTVDSATEPVITLDGKPVIQLASNNYLGLANHTVVESAAIEAIRHYGVGSGASRLISGNQTPHQELETTLAQFKTTEAALTFGSGYSANTGIIPTLVGPQDCIVADRLCHASLIDGCRISQASLRVFHHNDTTHLKQLLEKRAGTQKTLIITEGVFSMDGDLAPLPELVRLANEFQATLLLDDAHGTGVMGQNGRGCIEHFGIDPNELVQIGTLSKALGTIGGYVVGSRTLIDYLMNTSRSFIYTTAPPPSMVAAAQAAINIVQSDSDRRTQLWHNREHLYQGLKGIGFQLTTTQSPILPIILNDPKRAVEISARLLEYGIYVPAIRPPTVPKGTSRLRVTVTSEHTSAHIETALRAFETVKKELDLKNKTE
ncbi:MAG: 8-amino-7-oxononanoate synthase [Nitrospirales bacterium]|nr:MAG: 8-amino-7-oxononanoate synthase [Nitrospirales bacterium]